MSDSRVIEIFRYEPDTETKPNMQDGLACQINDTPSRGRHARQAVGDQHYLLT
ncbi:hypothetical protein [Trinickia soli]|uniref:hypothetical protein n=1 Tax=Trinickia soli TaxID=380675 RepID=UPI001304D6CD|nr:hypothetical protein [Trinickia soli]CAB3671755.1 hypothetical protein LMG24076_01982 [Trinickia soli]